MDDHVDLIRRLDDAFREHAERMRRIVADYIAACTAAFKAARPGVVIPCPGFIKLSPPDGSCGVFDKD